MRNLLAVTLLLIALIAVRSASAQEGATHESSPEDTLYVPAPAQGHYVAFGLYFTGPFADDADRGFRGPGFGEGFNLRLGEALVDWFDLGIAFALTSGQDDDGLDLTLGRLTVTGQYYLGDRWFLRAEAGMVAAVVRIRRMRSSTGDATGMSTRSVWG